jgi:hypothetical protein
VDRDGVRAAMAALLEGRRAGEEEAEPLCAVADTLAVVALVQARA